MQLRKAERLKKQDTGRERPRSGLRLSTSFRDRPASGRLRAGTRDGSRDGFRPGRRDVSGTASSEGRRDEDRDAWIYGLNPVLEALRAGREVKTVYVLAGRREKIDEVGQAASGRGVP